MFSTLFLCLFNLFLNMHYNLMKEYNRAKIYSTVDWISIPLFYVVPVFARNLEVALVDTTLSVGKGVRLR
jgi:hypothetical protein